MLLVETISQLKCVEVDYGIRLKKCSSLRGVVNSSSPFYGLSILTFNFASRSSGPFFLSSSLQLIAYSLVFLVFVAEPTFMQQNFAYDVGLVSTYSAH